MGRMRRPANRRKKGKDPSTRRKHTAARRSHCPLTAFCTELGFPQCFIHPGLINTFMTICTLQPANRLPRVDVPTEMWRYLAVRISLCCRDLLLAGRLSRIT